MSRGAQAQTQNLTDQQLSSINALNQGFLGQQQQLSGVLTPQFQSILNNPGLSPADKAAVTGNSQGSIASAFDSLQQSAANRVARTRNSAGFADLTDDLARQKANAEGNQSAQNQLSFSNTAFQRQMAALQGLSGLFGVDSNLLGRTLGIPSQLLSVRANASRPLRLLQRPRQLHRRRPRQRPHRPPRHVPVAAIVCDSLFPRLVRTNPTASRSRHEDGSWVPHPQLLEGAGLDSAPPQTKFSAANRSVAFLIFRSATKTQTTMPLHTFTLSQPTLTGLLTTLLPVIVQFALFLRWLHRRMREDEIVHACVRDIALTHLPHIYTTLQAIGAKQGITLHEFPVIHFVDLGRNHSRST